MVNDFPVPSRDVTNQILPDREKLNCSRPGRVWLVTSRLGTGKSLTFFYSAETSFLPALIRTIQSETGVFPRTHPDYSIRDQFSPCPHPEYSVRDWVFSPHSSGLFGQRLLQISTHPPSSGLFSQRLGLFPALILVMKSETRFSPCPYPDYSIRDLVSPCPYPDYSIRDQVSSRPHPDYVVRGQVLPALIQNMKSETRFFPPSSRLCSQRLQVLPALIQIMQSETGFFPSSSRLCRQRLGSSRPHPDCAVRDQFSPCPHPDYSIRDWVYSPHSSGLFSQRLLQISTHPPSSGLFSQRLGFFPALILVMKSETRFSPCPYPDNSIRDQVSPHLHPDHALKVQVRSPPPHPQASSQLPARIRIPDYSVRDQVSPAFIQITQSEFRFLPTFMQSSPLQKFLEVHSM